MSFSGKIAITTLKLIQNAKVGGVLENSGYLLPNGHTNDPALPDSPDRSDLAGAA